MCPAGVKTAKFLASENLANRRPLRFVALKFLVACLALKSSATSVGVEFVRLKKLSIFTALRVELALLKQAARVCLWNAECRDPQHRCRLCVILDYYIAYKYEHYSKEN